MKDYFGYAGLNCVVTGASSGMGKATAEMLVELGADVYALDRNPCDVPGIKKFVSVSLSDPQSIDAAFAEMPKLSINSLG
jgi:NAD(P)-dependent dehydrogenase (short-subunit alcohol dehydrogenase family)